MVFVSKLEKCINLAYTLRGVCKSFIIAPHTRVRAWFTRAPLGVRAQIGGKDNEKNSISGHAVAKKLFPPYLLTHFA